MIVNTHYVNCFGRVHFHFITALDAHPERVEKKSFFFVMCRSHAVGKIYLLLTQTSKALFGVFEECELHMKNIQKNEERDLTRRAILKTGGAAVIAGWTTAAGFDATASSLETPGISPATRNAGPLGARLQGVQHFGLTVQNMDRAFALYTEVLGGAEVMRDGDFQGERIHNTLLTDQEIEARTRKVNPRTMGIPDLKGGTQRLDVRFIQFDNVVIELL